MDGGWPSISFGGGGMGQASFLVEGSPAFVLLFNRVEAVSAYEETPYWSLSEEKTRPQNALNIIQATPLLLRLRAFRDAPELEHFLLCGGDMCAEVIAAAYAIFEYPTTEEAKEALARKMRGEWPYPRLRWLHA
jgi:hypothetical protein